MKWNRVYLTKGGQPLIAPSGVSCRVGRLIRLTLLLFFLSTATVLTAFGSPETTESQGNPSNSVITLPSPKSEGTLSLEEALNKRGAVRDYSPQPLSLENLAQLLWAGCGIQVDAVSGPTRTAPSAGALYPQELFVFIGHVEHSENSSESGSVDSIESGVYRYEPRDHRLVQLYNEDRREELALAALNQSFIAQAPAVIVIGGVVERTAAKYGTRGAERYVFLDAGHSAQNISLQATSRGLASAIVGAFADEKVTALLAGAEALPLYIIPVGQP